MTFVIIYWVYLDFKLPNAYAPETLGLALLTFSAWKCLEVEIQSCVKCSITCRFGYIDVTSATFLKSLLFKDLKSWMLKNWWKSALEREEELKGKKLKNIYINLRTKTLEKFRIEEYTFVFWSKKQIG